MDMTIAAVCGLAAEARIARRAGLRAVATGGDPASTAAKIERLIAEGARALVSFGIAGALDPALASGSLLLPQAVRTADDRIGVDAAWHAALAAALRRGGAAFAGGDILASPGVLASAKEKAEVFARYRGTVVAVDTESHAVAGAARAAGLPFIVFRAVADPAARELPPAALGVLDDEGRAPLGGVLRSLWAQPWQIPRLVAVALEVRRALAALSHGLRAIDGAALACR